MKLIRNRADVWGLILLAVLALGGVILALVGYEGGPVLLSIMAGIILGIALVLLATRPRRIRKPVTLVLLLSVPVLFLVSVAGVIHGVRWPVLVPSASGLIVGGIQSALGRLLGIGPWAGD